MVRLRWGIRFFRGCGHASSVIKSPWNLQIFYYQFISLSDVKFWWWAEELVAVPWPPSCPRVLAATRWSSWNQKM